MTAGQWSFALEEGSTFERSMTWSISDAPVDLTGYTARLQVRATRSPDSPVLLELTTENGGITLGDVDGTIALLVTDEQTALLDFRAARYDLKMIPPSGAERRLLEGTVRFSREVTD